MEGTSLVFVLLIFGSVVVMAKPTWEDEEDAGLTISPSTCDVDQGSRTSCGWGGIDESKCKSYGCCWDPHSNQQCYQRASCGMHPNARHECGWLGINNDTCVRRGCCWDDTDQYAKFCYVKRNTHLPDGLCPVAPSERKECGYYGITKEECLGKSPACCWDPTVADAKWCFHQPEEKPSSCLIYGKYKGTCKYVCDKGEQKNYLAWECGGRICCYNSH